MTPMEYCTDFGYEDVILFEGYETAFLGVSTDNRAVYSYQNMIAHLMKFDGMDYDEAIDFIDFNTIGSLGFEGCPIVFNEAFDCDVE